MCGCYVGTNSGLLTKPAPARSRGKDISNLIGEAGANLPQSSDEDAAADKGGSEEEEGEGDEGRSGKGGKENKKRTGASPAAGGVKPKKQRRKQKLVYVLIYPPGR